MSCVRPCSLEYVFRLSGRGKSCIRTAPTQSPSHVSRVGKENEFGVWGRLQFDCIQSMLPSWGPAITCNHMQSTQSSGIALAPTLHCTSHPAFLLPSTTPPRRRNPAWIGRRKRNPYYYSAVSFSRPLPSHCCEQVPNPYCDLRAYACIPPPASSHRRVKK